MKNADVTDEELYTCFIGVESLLNSGPLTTVSDDPNDAPVLKPNHFIIGQMGGDILPESVDMTEFNPRHLPRMATLVERISAIRWLPPQVVL